MKYIPKRMISVMVEDEFVPAVVAVITKVNRTGNFGDGRIFVCPIEQSVRIRTGERGNEAIT
jgi:nitrogen regulatory protein PII 2